MHTTVKLHAPRTAHPDANILQTQKADVQLSYTALLSKIQYNHGLRMLQGDPGAPAHTTFVIPSLLCQDEKRPAIARQAAHKPITDLPYAGLHQPASSTACKNSFAGTVSDMGSGFCGQGGKQMQQVGLGMPSVTQGNQQLQQGLCYLHTASVGRSGAEAGSQYMQHEGKYQQTDLASPPATPGAFSIAPPMEAPPSTQNPGIVPSARLEPSAAYQIGRNAVWGQQEPVLSPFMQRVACQMQHDAAMLADADFHAQRAQLHKSGQRLHQVSFVAV